MKKSSTRFAIFGNTYQPQGANCLKRVVQVLEKQKAAIIMEQDFYNCVLHTLPQGFRPKGIFTNNDFSAHFAISIGGDGTFLKTAAAVGDKGIPIIGINTGRLGFLADIQPDEIENLTEALAHGQYSIERRSVLRLKTQNEKLKPYPCALNEVAILKHDHSSMISIEVSVDDTYLNTYQSDGLILSTPTGSTGYSLSVGGPIVMPTSNSVVISPVAAHSLNTRPIVLNDNCTIKLKVSSRNRSYLLSVDGRSQSLSEETTLVVRKAPYYIYIVRKYGRHYFETLRNKLMWGADMRSPL